MKLILPLALLTTLASCTFVKTNSRPTAAVPCVAAPNAIKGMSYGSQGAGLAVNGVVDGVDDVSNGIGKVADHESRDYTNIGMNSAFRTDDVVYRETNRYTDYAMDTVDDTAGFGSRAIRRWPGYVTGTVQRGMFATKKVYQSAMYTYGESVGRGWFGFWDILNPPEPKPYMVGSLNDLNSGYALPGSSHRCSLPQLPPEPEQEETSGKNPKNPVTASK